MRRDHALTGNLPQPAADVGRYLTMNSRADSRRRGHPWTTTKPTPAPRWTPNAWAYLAGGAADECTVRANADAWHDLQLLPRVLRPLASGHTQQCCWARELVAPDPAGTRGLPNGSRAPGRRDRERAGHREVPCRPWC